MKCRRFIRMFARRHDPGDIIIQEGIGDISVNGNSLCVKWGYVVGSFVAKMK